MERRNDCLEAPLKKEETDSRLRSGLAGWARRAWCGAAWGRGGRVYVLASCVGVGARCRAGRRGRGAGWPSRSRQPGAGGGAGSSASAGWVSGARGRAVDRGRGCSAPRQSGLSTGRARLGRVLARGCAAWARAGKRGGGGQQGEKGGGGSRWRRLGGTGGGGCFFLGLSGLLGLGFRLGFFLFFFFFSNSKYIFK
jgi:hypothetical protein